MQNKTGNHKGLWIGLTIVAVMIIGVMVLHHTSKNSQAASGVQTINVGLVMMDSPLLIWTKAGNQRVWILRLFKPSIKNCLSINLN